MKTPIWTASGRRRIHSVLPAGAQNHNPTPYSIEGQLVKMLNLRQFGIAHAPYGGAVAAAGGYNAAADLVTQTIDGFDLNSLWTEFQQTMAVQNAQRQTMVNFLTFGVTNPQERVPQVNSGKFERASEYGEPRGIRPAAGYFNLGYDFDWYDLAARFTWKFLAEAPASQVEAINSMAITADNELVFGKVMDALFQNANREADINGVQDVPVYALYNADGTVPPSYKSNTFDGTHTHYMVSGAAALVSGDIDDMYENLRHHGYSFENGTRVLMLVNSAQSAPIRTFRVATGAAWDFIPAAGAPGLFLPRDQALFGTQVAASLQGLNVIGSYGPVVIIEEDLIPPGYVLMTGSGGPDNLQNPVGFRQHANASLRGLRLVKGPNPDYPLIDSFYNRGFGTGIRQRGGSVVMQVKESGAYEPPTAYVV